MQAYKAFTLNPNIETKAVVSPSCEVWEIYIFKSWRNPHCRLYIFTRFSLWSLTFFPPFLVSILENASRFCPCRYISDENCIGDKRKLT